MPNKTDSAPSTSEAKRAKITAEEIFKYVCIVLFLVLVYFTPGFLRFRQYCESKGLYVASSNGYIAMTIGFFAYFVRNNLT